MAIQGQAAILTRKEQETVLKSFIGTKFELRNRAMFLLGFRAGLRAKELAQVNTDDFLSRPLNKVPKLSSKTMKNWNSVKPTKANLLKHEKYMDDMHKEEMNHHKEFMKFHYQITLDERPHIPYTDEDIKQTVTLRSDVTKGSKVEKAIIRSEELREALVDYFNIYREQYQRGSKINSKINGISPILKHYGDMIVNGVDIRYPLFVTNKGIRFSPNGVSHLIVALSRSSGVSFTSHSGRRTLCTELVHKGTNIFDVQQLMRHKDISTTMLYYQKDESRLGEIMESL